MPPSIASLSIAASPFLRRKRLHGQRVDFLAHPLAQRRIDKLMTLDARQPGKFLAHDHRLEVLAVAGDFDVLARDPRFNRMLDVLG